MDTEEKPEKRKGLLELIEKLYIWTVDRLQRTMFMGIKFTLPKIFLNPLSFLGVLTAVTFLILGVTGGLLMFYYKPTLLGAYDSVKTINDTVSWGLVIRNLHYHASNAMVFLAVAHMMYLFYVGRYKIKNELIWVTGVIMGTLTVLEAYTGYDLIMNERAVLAINIGASLTNSVPVVGPQIAQIIMGTGFSDLVLRFYSLHVFILPLVMIIIVFIHFPRALVIDIPIVVAVTGILLIVSGLAPIELGFKFRSDVPPGITVPEWYLAGIYAYIRTGIDKFVAGVLIPTVWIIIFLVAPFIDRGKKLKWYDRPLFTAIGVTTITQSMVYTGWGFYINPDVRLGLVERIFIDPFQFFFSIFVITAVSVGLVFWYARWYKKSQLKPRERKPVYKYDLSDRWASILIFALIGFLVFLNVLTIQAFIDGFKNLAMFELGTILLAFSVMYHLIRHNAGKHGVSL